VGSCGGADHTPCITNISWLMDRRIGPATEGVGARVTKVESCSAYGRSTECRFSWIGTCAFSMIPNSSRNQLTSSAGDGPRSF
jgi:hypothetical protein